jgi:predicted HTH transcriptional regulator
LDISNDKFKAEFVQTITAIANAVPDAILPFGLLIVGVHQGKVRADVEKWLKDDNEYQKLMRKYCDPSIRFSFTKLERDGKKFGVFIIENDQERPHFVKENLIMKNKILLARGQIYVRNGSETVVALKREFKDHIIFSARATHPQGAQSFSARKRRQKQAYMEVYGVQSGNGY